MTQLQTFTFSQRPLDASLAHAGSAVLLSFGAIIKAHRSYMIQSEGPGEARAAKQALATERDFNQPIGAYLLLLPGNYPLLVPGSQVAK